MKKVLLISNLPIEERNSGPSIRYINIAKVLNSKFKCALYASKVSDNQKEKLDFLFSGNFFKLMKEMIKSEVIVSQPTRIRYLLLSRILRKRIVIDLYDPTDIENLEMYKDAKDIVSLLKSKYSTIRLRLALMIGDYFLVSNDIQKKYWIGYLQAYDRINLKAYRDNNKLENLIGMLPYGIEEDRDSKKKNIINQKFSNIKSSDKVFIWGGGIWNWFDTKNLIYAMNELKDENPRVKLLFLGVPSSYNKNNPKYRNLSETIELAEKLKVINKNVFFNTEWVEYEKRDLYLKDSYAGISLHYDNLETEFSFRTRILDYIWCNLPFVTTKGDYFAEFNEKNNIGISVDFNSVDSIKNGILQLLDDDIYMIKKNNIKKIKKNFLWENTCKDLINFIQKEKNVSIQKKSLIGVLAFLFKSFFQFLFTIIRRK